ncbi:MAG: hypothetical protein HC764_07790 [Pleurocapsa sp. CRU_1_2]|nr:hypothetical protein [Pleurocapsa sp. CRU_1_2]
MRPYKIHTIDLTCEYPCPCRRNGKLQPIILTEALGCDRCQQLFVVKKDGQTIEQLSFVYQKNLGDGLVMVGKTPTHVGRAGIY